MSAAKMGAWVKFCGHDVMFMADIHRVGNVNVIVGPETGVATDIYADKVDRKHPGVRRPATGATHHMTDMPCAGYWSQHRGIFVVPEKQVKELKKS